jgi:hypothetical protein
LGVKRTVAVAASTDTVPKRRVFRSRSSVVFSRSCRMGLPLWNLLRLRMPSSPAIAKA